jgi:transposase
MIFVVYKDRRFNHDKIHELIQEWGSMRPRITASKAKVTQVERKVNKAREEGDVSTFRRGQAILAVLAGETYETIASILGITPEIIRQWVQKFLGEGSQFLKVKYGRGRPPLLSVAQKRELYDAIKNGPEIAGYEGGCWRSPMVQHLIHQRFGVFYSTAYIAQLLKNLGLSFQKARFESAHLSPAARRKWLKETWPKILALSKKRSSHLLFGDEVSFPQWGSLSYTWAPKGKQPTVKTAGLRRGYKVFGLIDYWTGKFFHKSIKGKFTSETYSMFLREVLAQTRKHLIIIQDGARYHTSEDMQAFFYEHKERITPFQMPAYSPDYNPIEGLWKKIKTKGVHLKYFPTFESLVSKVDEMLAEFAELPKEILKVFGFYTKAPRA